MIITVFQADEQIFTLSVSVYLFQISVSFPKGLLYNGLEPEGRFLMADTLLQRFHGYFHSRRRRKVENYALPDLFTLFSLPKHAHTPTVEGEVLVNPYVFFYHLFDHILDKGADIEEKTPLSALPGETGQNGAWLERSVIYSSLVRTSASWDSDRNGRLEGKNLHGEDETGSFLKMVALLPFLQRMGVDTLYLLPVMEHGRRHSKGDAGSPYSVIDFFRLDPSLKESLTGEDFTIDEEFRALVDAAHALGIRVLIDIIPRTNGLESRLMREHPEWFYWIKKSEEPFYRAPEVPGVAPLALPEHENLAQVYQSEDVKRHLGMFRFDPKTLHPERFATIKDEEDILAAIEREFDLTVAPAFSDRINDPQPPWDDVTFLRLYLDHPKKAKMHLEGKDKPPYILFDTIKANLHPGTEKNEELWDLLADILPHYQRSYGIDGARIDMGHALPSDLLERIIKRARAIDPDFGLIAEELDPGNAAISQKKGYNIMTGNGFYALTRPFTGDTTRFIEDLAKREIPFFAAAETHDTPRLAAREGGEPFAFNMVALCYFLPNAVPFINSGLEVLEKQAMNLGLDASDRERRRLPLSDPLYGKLALFDHYALHYKSERRHVIPAILKTLAPLRKAWLDCIMDPERFFFLPLDPPHVVGFAYGKEDGRMLFVFSNLDCAHEVWQYPDIGPLRQRTANHNRRGELLFSTHERPRAFTQFLEGNVLDIHLGPGEIKIIEIA